MLTFYDYRVVSHSSLKAFNMRLHEFLSLVEDKDKLIDFLIERKVIHRQIECPRCKSTLNLNRDHMLFKCHDVRYEQRGHKKRRKVWCNFKVSAFHKTWFSHIHLSIETACRFIGYFLMISPPRQTFLMDELNIQSEAVVNWSNFCREVLLYIYFHNVIFYINIYLL